MHNPFSTIFAKHCFLFRAHCSNWFRRNVAERKLFNEKGNNSALSIHCVSLNFVPSRSSTYWIRLFCMFRFKDWDNKMNVIKPNDSANIPNGVNNDIALRFITWIRSHFCLCSLLISVLKSKRAYVWFNAIKTLTFSFNLPTYVFFWILIVSILMFHLNDFPRKMWTLINHSRE